MALPFHTKEYFDGEDAAALMSAGVGMLALGMVNPVGAWLVTTHRLACTTARPLLTALAVGVWAGAWLVFHWHWRGRAKPAKTIVGWAGGLTALGLLLGTPIITWFWQGVHLP